MRKRLKTISQKLGIKKDFRVIILNPPDNYKEKLTDLPANVTFTNKVNHLDLIQFFTTSKLELINNFLKLKKGLKKDGVLWICWPKRTSGISADLNEKIVREVGDGFGLKDLKIDSIDKSWSGLKFIYKLP